MRDQAFLGYTVGVPTCGREHEYALCTMQSARLSAQILPNELTYYPVPDG